MKTLEEISRDIWGHIRLFFQLLKVVFLNAGPRPGTCREKYNASLRQKGRLNNALLLCSFIS